MCATREGVLGGKDRRRNTKADRTRTVAADKSEAVDRKVSHVPWCSCHLEDLCRLWWAAIARQHAFRGLIRFPFHAVSDVKLDFQHCDELSIPFRIYNWQKPMDNELAIGNKDGGIVTE